MERGLYSNEKAQAEAQKVSELVGEKGSSADYLEAEGIVEKELAEHYASFDELFFDEAGSGEQSRSELSTRYRMILSDKAVNEVLAGTASVRTLSPATLRELETLITGERLHSANIQKSPRSKSLQPLLEKAGVRKLTPDQLRYVEGRVQDHFYRMLLPDVYYPDRRWRRGIPETTQAQSRVCQAFVKDYLDFIANMNEPDDADAYDVDAVIGGESSDVMTFWTLAPYINDELQREGFGRREAIAKVFDWVREAHKRDSRKSEPQKGEHSLPHPTGYRQNYVLGLDERMPSHLLSRLYAKEVVGQMLEQAAA